MVNVIMVSVIMVSVIMVSVIMVSVIKLNVVILSVIMLNVVMLSVAKLSVVVPHKRFLTLRASLCSRALSMRMDVSEVAAEAAELVVNLKKLLNYQDFISRALYYKTF
jgi:hypothetical protein